jgi:hypothetical protein
VPQGREKTTLTPCVAPGSKPRDWMTRRYGECAFPIETPEGLLSCCLPTLDGSSYCSVHHRVVYIGKPSPRTKPKVFY